VTGYAPRALASRCSRGVTVEHQHRAGPTIAGSSEPGECACGHSASVHRWTDAEADELLLKQNKPNSYLPAPVQVAGVHPQGHSDGGT
jgi:hypothetical protein